MTEPEMYNLDREDRGHIDEAAEWFLGTLKPRTASEVRDVLARLYLNGMVRGIQQAAELLEESIDELGDK